MTGDDQFPFDRPAWPGWVRHGTAVYGGAERGRGVRPVRSRAAVTGAAA